ncbi:MAG: L-aspartate oxidase, partial [Lentisphaeria bacterium]|nr:L-aspartate oxidase [Lentisphaeria bacterium]
MKSTSEIIEYDHLVVGSGLAGLMSALKLAEAGGTVAILTKRKINEGSTPHAQGGIACVTDSLDTFVEHVRDTLVAGAGLCRENVVRAIVEAGPQAVNDLINRGVHFTTRGEMGKSGDANELDLGREGGHQKRRILHAGDISGAEIERALVEACQNNKNITIYEDHIAIDVIVTARLGLPGANRCLGLYALDTINGKVKSFRGLSTTIACGGVGKVYLYTSNPDVACGGGVAMCYRAGAEIANMEFIQFHPTILYHPQMRSFLISEAVRGEGAVLKIRNKQGKLVEFMDKYHSMKSLAPRDVVARAIDNEMKRSGEECVFLDITHKSEEELRLRFPNIFEKCLEIGVNMAHDPIPVVPAEHYSCGGVKTDVNGATNIAGLYAVGESACTGLHGANRLASNSLLEAVVCANFSAKHIREHLEELRKNQFDGFVPPWHCGNATNSDEQVVI